MIQELIFTSAPRGLQLGKSGYCTVASTAGMAENVARLLESLSGYRHLFPPGTPGASANPVNFSHLIAKVGGRDLHIISRVADTGLDYSGRSNKIAHHIACDKSELPPGGSAAVLRSMPFETRWDREPERLLPRKLAGGRIGPGVCQAWAKVSGDAGWGGALAEAGAKRRPAVVIISPGMPALEMVLESLALIPDHLQDEVTFSTFYTNLPANVQCLWRFVIADSPEAAAAKRNPQNLVIDCTDKLGSCPSPAADEARQGQLYSPKAAISLPAATPLPNAVPAAEPLLELAEDDVSELPPDLPRGSGPPVPPQTPYQLAPDRRVRDVMEVTIPDRRGEYDLTRPASYGRRGSRRDHGDAPDRINIIGVVMLVLGLLMMLAGGGALYTAFGPRLAESDSKETPLTPPRNLPTPREEANVETKSEQTNPLIGETSPESEKTQFDAGSQAFEKGEGRNGNPPQNENPLDEKGNTPTGMQEESKPVDPAAEESVADDLKKDEKKPEMPTFTVEILTEPGVAPFPTFLLLSPTAIKKGQQYAIAKLDIKVVSLLEQASVGNKLVLRTNEQNENEITFEPIEGSMELVAVVATKGCEIRYSICEDGTEGSLLTVSFSRPLTNEWELSGSIAFICESLNLKEEFPVVPARILRQRLSISKIFTGGLIFNSGDNVSGVTRVSFLSDLFELMNEEALGAKVGGFTLSAKNINDKQIEFNLQEPFHFSPILKFKVPPSSTNDKAEWVFQSDFSSADKEWERLVLEANLGIPEGSGGKKSANAEADDKELLPSRLAKLRNQLKSCQEFLDSQRDLISKIADKDQRIQGFEKLAKIDAFLASFSVLKNKEVGEELEDYFKKLVFVFRCDSGDGSVFVLLADRNDRDFDAIELDLRRKLGVDIYRGKEAVRGEQGLKPGQSPNANLAE